jgi:hypothetical protein
MSVWNFHGKFQAKVPLELGDGFKIIRVPYIPNFVRFGQLGTILEFP